MEKIKAKVDGLLHKNDDTTTTGTSHNTTPGTHNTTGTSHNTTPGTHNTTGTHGTHSTSTTTGGLTGNPGTHTGVHGDERHGNPSHIGSTGHSGGLDGSTSHTSHTGGGLTGNTHTGTHTGSNAYSDPSGPHDTRTANLLDPAVNNTHNSGGLSGSTHAGHSAGHSTGLPASTHNTGSGLTGTGNTHSSHTGGGLTGSDQYGAGNTLPHDSRLGNKADPRVDSDRIGGGHSSGLPGTGNTHSSHTGTGLPSDQYGAGNTHSSHTGTGLPGSTGGYGNPTQTEGYGNHSAGGLSGTPAAHNTHAQGQHGLTGQGSLPGPAPNTAGNHKSDMLNKIDPRVDADLDGSKTYGGNKTYGN